MVKSTCIYNEAFRAIQVEYVDKYSSDIATKLRFLMATKNHEEADKLRLELKQHIAKDPKVAEVFAKLKTSIPGEIIKQIHNLNNFNRRVLIVGDSDLLIKGVVSYIYYINASIEYNLGKKNTFHFIDCSGYDENLIKKEILEKRTVTTSICLGKDFPRVQMSNGNKYEIDKYLSGKTLFLRDFEGDKVFKLLIGSTRNTNGKHGMLIVSVPSIDKLTEEIISQFDVIRIGLELANSGKNSPPRGIKVKKQNKFITFPMPSGATVNEICMTFTDSNHIRIKVRETVENVHYSQMGFKHLHGTKRSKLWEKLRVFAVKNGTVTFQKLNVKKGNKISSTLEKPVTQDDIKGLKTKIRNYFGFSATTKLISYDKTNCAYKTIFQINDDTENLRNFKNQLNKNGFGEKNDHFPDPSVDE